MCAKRIRRHSRRVATGFSLPFALATLLVLSACREGKPARVLLASPFDAADSLRLEGRTEASARNYLALRDSFALTGDTASWWRAQLWLAHALLQGGHRDTAQLALDRAVQLAAGNANRVGWTRYMRSIFLDRVGRFDSAFVEASGAQTLGRATHDVRLEASAFSAMGRINSLSGRYHEALAANQRALALERAYGATPREIAKELNELGIDFRHLGRFTDAVAVYDTSLNIARRLRNPESIARVEFNLGNILMATGDLDAALGLYTDALARAELIGEVRGMAFIHGGLAQLYTASGAWQPARQHLDRALKLNRGAKLPYGEVQNLEAIGRLDLAEGHAAAGDSALRAALAIADRAHYGKERSTTRAALARAAVAGGHGPLRRKKLIAARQWADQAVSIADSVDDPEAQAESRAARGVALEAFGDRAASRAYLEAIDLLESWRGRLALGDLRMGVAEPRREVYEGAIRTLIASGRVEDAFQVAERARARLLLELMAERDMRGGRQSPEDNLRARVSERFAARSDAGKSAVVEIDREIDTLTSRLDSMQASARARDATAGVHYPGPARLPEIRSGLLPPGRAMVLFFWGERDVYGWWITSETIHAARLGSADSLAVMLEFMGNTLSRSDGTPDWQPAARHAFERLIAPLAPSPVEEILAVVDGPLAYTPLETFISSEGAAPWGASVRFVYGPSASVLLALARAPAHRIWSRAMLAVGDPAQGSNSGSPAESRSGDDMSALPPLPAAANEARGIAKLLGGDVLIGRDATLPRWLALDPSRYRYLHFATHALLNDRRPQRTALMLSGRRLDLTAIRRLRLSSELVTLSACETGLGHQLRGEGVIGLPHAFLAAGAHAVVVSLWRVQDQSAANYMADFYREIHSGRSPAAAMLAVRQLRIRSAGPAGHPSQWAPFILVGGDLSH